jgi:membrane protein implicated in regulation of membrane protease activity
MPAGFNTKDSLMNIAIEPWHWFIFGIALAVFEIFLPSFTIFWFGLAALMVSSFLWLFPALSVPTQIMIWIVLSISIVILWFKFIKPLSKDHTQAGLPREATIGQVGMVIALLAEKNEVKVRFNLPILGADEWLCRIHQPVAVGDRVTVIDILGNQLVVEPYTTPYK